MSGRAHVAGVGMNGVFILARPFVDPESLRAYAAAFFAAQNRVPPPAPRRPV